MNFSIIIPHKNIPNLLQRCLNSIPIRKDIEVIIVDDNSNPNIVNFDHFPGLNRKYTHVIFTKEGKGAGYARNIGIEHATGKWILFADADDLFLENLLDIIDSYVDSNANLILFKTKCRLTNDLTKEGYRQILCNHWNNLIDRYSNNKSIMNQLLEEYSTPWGKMVKHSFINKNNIRFEEIPFSNDVIWSTLLHINLDEKDFITSNYFLYCLTEREGSLYKNNNKTAFFCRFDVFYRQYCLLKKAGKKENIEFNYYKYYEIAKCFNTQTLLKFILHTMKLSSKIPTVYHFEKTLNLNYPYFYFIIIILQSIKYNFFLNEQI